LSVLIESVFTHSIVVQLLMRTAKLVCGSKRVRVGIRVGVAYSRNKLALRTSLRNLNLKSHFSIFNSFRDISVHTYDF